MKNPLTVLSVVVSVVLVLLAVEVFLLPGDKKRKRKRKKRTETKEEEVDLRPWQEKVERLEKRVRQLNEAVAAYQAKEKEGQKKLALEALKVKKYEEKVKQERAWQEKEQEAIEKTTRQLEALQKELAKEQETGSQEHQRALQLERELRSLEREHRTLEEKAKDLDKDLTKAKGENDLYRQDIRELKKEIAGLQKKKEDVQWVAKSEFDQLKTQAQALQKELDRIKRADG